MYWISERATNVKKASITRYIIKQGSVFDIPRQILAGVPDFEIALDDYYRKQLSDEALVREMMNIYLIYRDKGAVEVYSTYNRYLKNRHEHVIVKLIKENLAHLIQLSSYFKQSTVANVELNQPVLARV